MPRKKYQQKILTEISKESYQPVSIKKLAKLLGIPKDEMQEFHTTIKELHRSGRLVIGEDKTIHFPSKPGTITGTFWSHSKGFGFLVPADPNVLEDLYIPKEATKGAITGDLVQARVFYRRVGKQVKAYGKIEKILARGRNRFVGTLFRAGNHWIVETDGKVLHRPIIVEDVSAKGARSGDKVVVKLTEYPIGNKLPRGVIDEILGEAGKPSVELQAVIKEYDLPPTTFPQKIEQELDKIIAEFNTSVLDVLEKGNIPKDRLDLRSKTIITIDPVDAKDFDDAFHIDLLEDGYELGVHIADVSFFVKEGSRLDKEARERGNSVYLPRYVIPMLPEVLSNGLCSLQEGQPRLTKSVFIKYDWEGNVISTRFANSIISSSKRLTYEQVTDVLKGKKNKLSAKVIQLIEKAEHLAKLIFNRRYKNGMLHLDLPEIELEFNEEGEVIDAHPADMSFSHTIIEMFMVEANEAVAKLLDSCNIPFLRRIHPPPEEETLRQLREFLTLLGYKINKKVDRFELQKLIERVKNKPESFAVNYSILRSLQKAVYSPESIGHYALASVHYCHFTSPIRRYPDLTVHRLLNLYLNGKLKKIAKKIQNRYQEFKALGEHCSFTEQRAEDAERDIKETLTLQLLSKYVGEIFDGIVTGISSLGPFVRISKYMIEGLIPISEFGADRWKIDADKGIITGSRSGIRIKIGDPIKVQIVSVDTLSRKLNLAPVDFSISETEHKRKIKKQKKGKPKNRKRKKQKTS